MASIDDITADSVVGAQDGTTGETYAEENTDAEVRPFPEIDDAYNALASGQVDAVLNDLPSTRAAVEDNPDLEVAETFSTNELYGIVFPQGLEPRRSGQRSAADGQGQRHARATSTPSGSTRSCRRTCSTATHDPT